MCFGSIVMMPHGISHRYVRNFAVIYHALWQQGIKEELMFQPTETGILQN